MSGGDDDFPEEHEEHVNHEAWVIPYADLLTLLMAMFIALFAMSTVDITKFKAFAVGFNEALGGGKLDAGIGGSGKATSPVVGQGNGNGPFTGGTLMPSENSVDSKQLAQILSSISTGKIAGQTQRELLKDVAAKIEKAAKGLGLGGKVQTRQLNNGLEVTLLTDRVLFDPGQADIQPEGVKLLQVVGKVLTEIDNPLLITGYTDSDAIATARFPSNDELSFSRALAVKRYLQSIGIDWGRMDATGRGADNPVAPNTTAANKAKNRRVEILVQSKLVKQALDQAGLNGNPAITTPTSTPIEPGASANVGGATPNLSPGLGAG